jgi:hypothetical protein
MVLQELRPGLWRWTATHPEAEPDPEPESPADWPAEVGCVAAATRHGLVLVDPLVPDDDWSALDAIVDGRPVTVLTTIPFHARSRDAAIERYAASTAVPDGVEAIEIERAGETMFWLPEHRALVPGDRLLGFGVPPGELRLCPESWLGYLEDGPTTADLREELRKLLERPIELVLVSHGEPVLEDGRAALARALDRTHAPSAA